MHDGRAAELLESELRGMVVGQEMYDFAVSILGIALIGIGLWWHDPGVSLAVVGSILLIVTVATKLRRTPPNV